MPFMNEKREINWGFDSLPEMHENLPEMHENLPEMHWSPPRGWRRFGMHAALFVTAGLATMLVPSVLNNGTGPWEKESLFVAGSTPGATEGSSQDAANSPGLAIKHQQAAEQERERGEVLAHQLASSRGDVGTLTARVTALTDARTEAEKALQTAQASAAEQKLALEQERERGDALVRELASAREQVAEGVQNGAAVSRIEAGQAVQVSKASSQAGSVSPSTTRSVLFKRAPDGRGSASDPQHTAAGSVGKGHSAATPTLEPQNAALGDPTRVAAPPPRAIGEHQIALWVKRGEEFTAAGDFVSARLVFQRAAETGNANAAFMLAGTYDPAVLDRIRAMGVAPDIAKARLWYEKAKNLGSPEAARRLELLVQQSK